MSEQMTDPPVYYALAQARFNPVPAMEKYVSEIQDRLRHESYTLFDSQQVAQLQFAAVPGQALPEPKLVNAISWLIAKSDQTAGFILSESAITFHTTHYVTRNEFIPELLRGLDIVHAVVGLDHVSRLGLRYLDAVLPKPGEDLDLYLANGLHGVPFGPKRQYVLNESVFETETAPLLSRGTLIARVYQSVSPLGYPPDLTPGNLVPMPKFDNKDARAHAVIDTDHFVEGRMPLDFDKIREQLLALHAIIRLVFDATVTEHATSVWA